MANSRNVYDYESMFDKVTTPGGIDIDWNYSSRMTLSGDFISNSDGYIHAIRFWKPVGGPANDHIPEIWINSIKQSIDVNTFDPETASGWQVAWLTNAFFVSAGVIFQAAYNGPIGHNWVIYGDVGTYSSEHLSHAGPGSHGSYGFDGNVPGSHMNFHFGADVLFSLNQVVPGEDTGFTSNFRPWMGRF